MSFEKNLNVLMITGVYLPEINGAVRQCSHLINNLSGTINFLVLSGTNDKSVRRSDYINGTQVIRVFMPIEHKPKYWLGAIQFFFILIKILRDVHLVHVHGFSKRNAIVVLISLIFKKKIILKMTSYGIDDPMSVKASSFILWKIFNLFHAYIGISPAFTESYKKANLLIEKYCFIPNGVDLDKNIQIQKNEKNTLRIKYGYGEKDKVILFVGHFSPEKQPMLLYQAWSELTIRNIYSKLIFIGRTKNHFEVDESIAESIKKDAIQRGIIQLINFVEDTFYVNEYMNIADVLVLTSIREGLPNVLLEAMSCALPCIVNEISGVTDWLIEDGKTGVLFSSGKSGDLANKIALVLENSFFQKKIGSASRFFMEDNFSSTLIAYKVLSLYLKLGTLRK